MKNLFPRQKTLYSYKAVDALIDELVPQGWEWISFSEGTLGRGDGVLLSPDDRHYSFEYREVYLNEWSSAHTIRRFSKVSARIQAEIDRVMWAEEEADVA